VFLAPLLLLHRDEDWGKRAGIAAATALVALLPPVLIDPRAYYDSIIGNLTGVGFRADSVSIVGLLAGFGIRFEPAQWAWLIYAFAAAGLVSLGSSTRSTFPGRAGIILGVTFFMTAAFSNYWFLIMGMLAISTILDDRDRPIVGGIGLTAAGDNTTSRRTRVRPSFGLHWRNSGDHQAERCPPTRYSSGAPVSTI
jgi:uncharacterized membrane protein